MIKLRSPKEGATLSFTVTGTQFTKDLKTVTSVFSAGAEFLLVLDAGNIAVIGSDNTKTCALVVEAQDVKGNGCFIIDTEVIKGVLNNRDEVKFTLSGSQLSFVATKGKYSGDMTIQPAGSNAIEQLNELLKVEVNEMSLPDTVFAKLDKSIKHCDLGDAYAELNSELIRYIVGNKDKVTIATYDQFHSALLNTKLEEPLKKPFKIAVYQSHFGIINGLARGTELKIAISDRHFYVSGPHFFLSLPPIQYNEEEFNVVHEMMQSMLKQEKAASCTVDTSELSNAVDNICSIYELGSKIELKIKGERMNFKLATSYGSITDALKVHEAEGNCAVLCDAPPLNDVLKCCPTGACTFSVVDGKAYIMQYKTEDMRVSYIVAVLQS